MDGQLLQEAENEMEDIPASPALSDISVFSALDHRYGWSAAAGGGDRKGGYTRMAWFDMLPDPELCLVRNARKCWEDTYLGKTRRGQGWADYRLNLVLPVSLSMEAGTIPCTSADWGEHPTALVRLNEAGKRYWIERIANELNREVGLGLATAWSVGRTMSAVRRQEESVAMGRVFSIGASNAGNTAAALERCEVGAYHSAWMQCHQRECGQCCPEAGC
jgi:hypothetical protein